MRLPEVVRTQLALFQSVDDAANAVSAIMAAGILPAALELLDRACMEVVDQAIHIGFPEQAGAALIIELDGLNRWHAAHRRSRGRHLQATLGHRDAHGQYPRRGRAHLAQPSCRLWCSGPPGAYVLYRRWLRATDEAAGGPATGRSTSGGTMGSTSPISPMPATATCTHRSHFDINDPDACQRVMACGRDILRLCAELGGTITGEHGVGIEKQNEMPFVFSPVDLAVMHRVKEVIDPDNLCNPGKIFPSSTQPRLYS